ncbi:MAG: GNAT family N-acetyltransferase [Puniceicoccales bacterium]|jgi:ribosomal protein S18 acetylase RimI-like enzyme|nr:GNAT family N-acetyltransferase [Puniceicoccales bacterium]
MQKKPQASSATAPAARAGKLDVRLATEADIPALLDLADALVEVDREFDPSLRTDYNRSGEGVKWFHETLGEEEAAVFVAGAPAVFAMLIGRVAEAAPWRETGGRIAEVEMLCVGPEARGNGCGKALLEAFAAWARERGARRLWVRVSAANARALRFYRRELFRDYDVILERPA